MTYCMYQSLCNSTAGLIWLNVAMLIHQAVSWGGVDQLRAVLMASQSRHLASKVFWFVHFFQGQFIYQVMWPNQFSFQHLPDVSVSWKIVLYMCREWCVFSSALGLKRYSHLNPLFFCLPLPPQWCTRAVPRRLMQASGGPRPNLDAPPPWTVPKDPSVSI